MRPAASLVTGSSAASAAERSGREAAPDGGEEGQDEEHGQDRGREEHLAAATKETWQAG